MDEYWACMTQMKFNQIYMKLHYERNVRIVRMTNILQAVVATGALAFMSNTSWQCVLIAIMYVAQIFSAAKPFLPYEKRLTELDKGIALLADLYGEMELKWNQIYEGNIGVSEAAKLASEYKQKWDRIDSELLKEDSLPVIKKIRIKANVEKDKYFANYFRR